MAIATTTNTYNKHDYVQRLRSRINLPTTWADVLKVTYSDVRTIVNGYWSTEPATSANTRATAYTYSDYVTAQDTLTINQSRIIPVFIDEADRAQQNYVSMMGIADYQGKKISEYIESVALAAAIAGTNFGATDLANTGDDDTTAITVSASNIDDIIRAIKRKIYANNGVDFAVERGIFIVWRAGDFELLEALDGQALLKLSLIKSEVQRWITNTKQAIAVQVKRLSVKEPIFGYATV
jgi:hypothetical protein